MVFGQGDGTPPTTGHDSQKIDFVPSPSLWLVYDAAIVPISSCIRRSRLTACFPQVAKFWAKTNNHHLCLWYLGSSSHMLAPTAVACYYLLLGGTTDAFQFLQCSRCIRPPHLSQRCQQFQWQRPTKSSSDADYVPSTSWPSQCIYRRKFLSKFSNVALLVANVMTYIRWRHAARW